MYISRIAIDNFRNFSAIDLDDLPAGIVLVGENSSGKSNLLHALRLVLDPSLAEASRQLVADDFWDGLNRPFAGNEVKVVVELAGFDDDAAAKSVLGEFLVAHSPHRARLTYIYRPSSSIDEQDVATAAGYEVSVFGGIDESCRIGRSEWRYISLRVLPALRDAENSLRSRRSPLRSLISRSDVDDAVLADVATRIDEATVPLSETDQLSSIATAISGRLEDMVGELFSVQTSLGVLSTNPEQLLRSMRLFIDSERRRGVEQASLGTANLLYLTLLLEDISSQRDAEEIVELILGVEEPEAHLHPHVQRVLFRHLLSEGRALIVTTHSPHIVSVTPLASLVLLRESCGESRAFRARPVGLSALQEADIERYLDVTRAEMLFARIVILVEGLAELYLIPAFAQSAGLNLDALGVTVCSVHGTDFAPYVRLLSSDGLEIPYVVVTDGDPNKDGQPIGVKRAMRIIGDEAATDAGAAFDTGDYQTAREHCAEAGVMVGDHTLEIDLIPTATPEMIRAYTELVDNPLKSNRFEAQIEMAESDGRQRAKLLRRIEAVGKGRYAQRLAGHLAEVSPPRHIGAALDRVRELAENSVLSDEPVD